MDIFYGLASNMGFNFLDWMSANRTTGNRGVNSFTAEPTYLELYYFFKQDYLYKFTKIYLFFC